MDFKEVLTRIESSFIWDLALIISIIVSVFGPSAGVVMGASVPTLIKIVLYSNIIFVFDSAIRIILYKREYLFTIDFVVDISAILSAVFEYAFLAGTYKGPGIANMRVLRALKLVTRFSKMMKGTVRVGKIQRSTRAVSEMMNIKKNERNESSRYVMKIREKIESVVMILMAYIIIRFGSSLSSLSRIEEAKANIWFFAEMIIIMIVIGGMVDYYLKKLVGDRFRKIRIWVKEKSERHGFFKEIEYKADAESVDEVDFLERYLGFVLDKAAQFPVQFRKFIWGMFTPTVKKQIIFISDIENYSKKTANLSAQEINEILDDYIKKMVEIMVYYGAEIDKYVGDSIIAFFPPDKADFIPEMISQLDNLTFKQKLKTRIGLHYDNVIQTFVGPYGYRQMDHFSEGISITQRLQDHNKKTKTYLLISQQYYEILNEMNKKRFSYLGSFKPKGASRIFKYYKKKT